MGGQCSDGDDAAAGRCQCFAEELLGQDGGGGCAGREQAELACGRPEGFGLFGEPTSRGWGLSGACIAVIERRSARRRRAVLRNFDSMLMFTRKGMESLALLGTGVC